MDGWRLELDVPPYIFPDISVEIKIINAWLIAYIYTFTQLIYEHLTNRLNRAQSKKHHIKRQK